MVRLKAKARVDQGRFISLVEHTVLRLLLQLPEEGNEPEKLSQFISIAVLILETFPTREKAHPLALFPGTVDIFLTNSTTTCDVVDKGGALQRPIHHPHRLSKRSFLLVSSRSCVLDRQGMSKLGDL